MKPSIIGLVSLTESCLSMFSKDTTDVGLLPFKGFFLFAPGQSGPFGLDFSDPTAEIFWPNSHSDKACEDFYHLLSRNHYCTAVNI